MPYTLSRADGQDCEAACTLETSNSDRVEVRDGMKIYAKSAGVAYIRITAAGGAIALAKVVVWNFPDRMFFEYGEQTVKVGGTVKNRVGLFSGKDGFIYSETDGEGVGKFSTDNPAIDGRDRGIIGREFADAFAVRFRIDEAVLAAEQTDAVLHRAADLHSLLAVFEEHPIREIPDDDLRKRDCAAPPQ